MRVTRESRWSRGSFLDDSLGTRLTRSLSFFVGAALAGFMWQLSGTWLCHMGAFKYTSRDSTPRPDGHLLPAPRIPLAACYVLLDHLSSWQVHGQ